jgi:hypothetical protein
VGGVRYTALRLLFRLRRIPLDGLEEIFDAANGVPIRVPLTAIWSRRDGIVAWQACVDNFTPGAENFEARSVHWGLGIDPDVLEAVAFALGRSCSRG